MILRRPFTLVILLLLITSLTLSSGVNTALALGTCDSAQFITDVTVQDGTFINPGATFVKTWRLKNTGVCQWNTSYSLVFVSGTQMGGTTSVAFPNSVAPGQTVDLTVTLTAPTTGGTFRGYWQLKNSSGALFGIGVTHANPFWVEIRVTTPVQTVTGYDFVDNMCSAQWSYDGGPIPCPINTNKLLFGYVKSIANPVLEDGTTSPVHGLLTIPQSKYNGLIRGSFPVTDIFRGDHFQALIGCQFNAVNCFVTYMVGYQVGDSLFTLFKTIKRYDGLMDQVDVDLTRIAGIKNAKIVLTILSAGPFEGDQPLWVNPRIVRSAAVPVITPTPIGPTSVVPTNTPTSNTGCDRAQFITDVTIPDGTNFAPNAPFTKTWRLKNTGTCTWTTNYSLVFVSGDRMGGVQTLIPLTVVPGQTADVGINLVAPSVAGSYRGYWQLKNASGGLFGIGTTANQPFYVDIKVTGSASTGSIAYNFVSNVCSAQWFSGSGVLPCPGSDGDARGFVLSVANPQLENGTISTQPGILTNPQLTTNGYIQGFYPAFSVLSGDHFQSIVNCAYGASTCFVVFRLDYQIASGPVINLGTFAENYDGLYTPINIDLSSLSGQNVKFILTVLANGSSTGDRAMWVAPQIIRNIAIGGDVPMVPTQTDIQVTETPIPMPTDTPTVIPAVPTDTPTPLPIVPTDTGTPVPMATP